MDLVYYFFGISCITVLSQVLANLRAQVPGELNRLLRDSKLRIVDVNTLKGAGGMAV